MRVLEGDPSSRPEEEEGGRRRLIDHTQSLAKSKSLYSHLPAPVDSRHPCRCHFLFEPCAARLPLDLTHHESSTSDVPPPRPHVGRVRSRVVLAAVSSPLRTPGVWDRGQLGEFRDGVLVGHITF